MWLWGGQCARWRRRLLRRGLRSQCPRRWGLQLYKPSLCRRLWLWGSHDAHRWIGHCNMDRPAYPVAIRCTHAAAFLRSYCAAQLPTDRTANVTSLCSTNQSTFQSAFVPAYIAAVGAAVRIADISALAAAGGSTDVPTNQLPFWAAQQPAQW